MADAALKVLNAGREIGDLASLPPRQFLLGTVFCKRNASMLGGPGGIGKTAVRIAQYLALATGKMLTDEPVFKRSRVLLLSFEDDADELRRRIGAAKKHYGIADAELDGWFYFAALGRVDGKIALLDERQQVVPGPLARNLSRLIGELHLDLVAFDPFIKCHSVAENDNTGMDAVMEILTDLAKEHNIATDSIAHNNKGLGEPGDANRLRGASAQKDAARLVHTLTAMSKEEAERFGVSEQERSACVRFDRAKANYGRAVDAKWFKLVGVRLGNCNVDPAYPEGDEVQVAEPWSPPDLWRDLTAPVANRILDEIDAGLPDGNRYSNHHSAKERAAWHVVARHAPTKTEAQARLIIGDWIKSGTLVIEQYQSRTTFKQMKGLRVDDARRPA